MEIYKDKIWTISKIDIKQTQHSFRTQFFVDDNTGKNHRVFDTEAKARAFIANTYDEFREKFYELEERYKRVGE